MKKAIAGLLAAMVVFVLSGCKISGTITENGVGLEGVDVALSGGVTMATVTDQNGYYEFNFDLTNPARNSFSVTPSMVGYRFLPDKKDLSFPSGTSEITDVDFVAETDLRQALIRLYNATNGDQWMNNEGWKTPPLEADGFAEAGTEGSWYGVMLLPDGRFDLVLSNNNLSGPLPDTICEMTQLRRLDLSGNQLNGPIPECIGELTQLQELTLWGTGLSGPIPESIVNLADTHLAIGENHLHLEDPSLVAFLNANSSDWRFQTLNPEPVRRVLMDLYEATDGPNWTSNDGWGTDTDVGLWEGVILSPSGYPDGKFDLWLVTNNLNGPLPDSICELTGLQRLDLFGNQLRGPIPECIGELTQLQALDLSDNRLSGPIPGSIVSLTNTFTNLALNHLYIEDPALVEFLDLHISGWRHQTLNPEPVRRVLMELYAATDGPNWTHSDNWGTVAEVSTWWGVEVYPSGYPDGKFELWLPDNHLNGPLPASIGELTQLQVLHLDGNGLSGPIPGAIANLTDTELFLGWNHLYIEDPAIAEFLDLHSIDWREQTVGNAQVRRALMALYEATDGSNWTHNDHWGTDAEVATWFGVFASPSDYPDGKFDLVLGNNNLNGPLPADICELTRLLLIASSRKRKRG